MNMIRYDTLQQAIEAVEEEIEEEEDVEEEDVEEEGAEEEEEAEEEEDEEDEEEEEEEASEEVKEEDVDEEEEDADEEEEDADGEEEVEEEAVSIQLYELFNLQIEIIVCFFSLMKVCVGRYVSVFNGQRIAEFLEDPYEKEWASQANDDDESEH